MGSVLHLIIYGLLNVALIVMREAQPADYQPDYEVPFYPFTPILGMLTSSLVQLLLTTGVLLVMVLVLVF